MFAVDGVGLAALTGVGAGEAAIFVEFESLVAAGVSVVPGAAAVGDGFTLVAPEERLATDLTGVGLDEGGGEDADDETCSGSSVGAVAVGATFVDGVGFDAVAADGAAFGEPNLAAEAAASALALVPVVYFVGFELVSETGLVGRGEEAAAGEVAEVDDAG